MTLFVINNNNNHSNEELHNFGTKSLRRQRQIGLKKLGELSAWRTSRRCGSKGTTSFSRIKYQMLQVL